MNVDDAIRNIFKGSAIVFIGTVFELGFSFVGKVFIARHLSRVDFGAVTIGITLLTLTGGLSVLGLNTGVARYLPRYDSPGTRRDLVITSCLFGAILPVALSVVGTLLPGQIATIIGAPDSTRIIRLFAFGIPMYALVDIGIGVTRGQQRSLPYVIVQNFTKPIVRLIGIGIGVVIGASVVGMSIAYLLPHFIAFGITVFFLWKSFDWLSSSVNLGLGKQLISFSIPLGLSSIFATIISDIDTVLLSYFTETGVVGDYGVIYPLAQLVSVSLTATGFIVMPILSEFHAEDRNEELGRLYQVGTKWIFILSFPPFIILSFFPTISIAMTFGWEYVEGARALQILTIGTFLSALLGLNSNVLSSIGETKYIAGAQAGAAVLNVILNILLIPRYGIEGAATATLVSAIVLNAIVSFRVYTELEVHPFSSGLIRLAIIVMPIFLTLRVVLLRNLEITPQIAGLVSLVLVSGYTIAIPAFGGIEREEIMIIHSIEERFNLDLEPIKRWLRLLM